MNDARLLGGQLVLEQKRFWRNPTSAVSTFAFPIVLLMIFASLNHGEISQTLGGIQFDQYFVPAIVAFGVMSACFVNVAVNLSIRRDMGLLKRIRGTPLPPGVFLGALLVNAVFIAVVLGGITTVLGTTIYGVTFYPERLTAMILALVLGATSFCALGVAVSTFVPNADAAPAVVNAVYFPLTIISGVFFPLSHGSVLLTVARVFPLYHLVQAIFATFDPVRAGSEFAGGDLLMVAAWGLLGAVVAVRRFRWAPRVH